MRRRTFFVTLVLTLVLAFSVARAVGGRPATTFTALVNASRAGQLDVMARLVADGADVNARDEGGNHWIPLMHAIHKHQTESVRFLLAHGALAEGPPHQRPTPIQMAVSTGQTEIVRLLLDKGANPRREPGEMSLLTMAVAGGALMDIDEAFLGRCHAETIRLLQERAPDLKVDGGVRGVYAHFFAWWNDCKVPAAPVPQAVR